jgi:hypothetical protein
MSKCEITCRWCKATVVHNPRHLEGCNCDPDSPYWCYVNKEGTPGGLRMAQFNYKKNEPVVALEDGEQEQD